MTITEKTFMVEWVVLFASSNWVKFLAKEIMRSSRAWHLALPFEAWQFIFIIRSGPEVTNQWISEESLYVHLINM